MMSSVPSGLKLRLKLGGSTSTITPTTNDLPDGVVSSTPSSPTSSELSTSALSSSLSDNPSPPLEVQDQGNVVETQEAAPNSDHDLNDEHPQPPRPSDFSKIQNILRDCH